MSKRSMKLRNLFFGLSYLLLLVISGCAEPDMECSSLGLEGCPCASGDSCQVLEKGEASLVCQSGLCTRTEGCTAGSENCACAPSERCAAGLSCGGEEGAKVCLPRCAKGSASCACFEDGSCGSDVDGILLLCGPEGCVRSDCEPGSRGCVCAANGDCASGSVCNGRGFCEADTGQTLVPPVDARCFTPCQGGGITRMENGREEFVSCSSEGLLPGCIDGALCIEGSCVSTNQKSKTKVSDADNAAAAKVEALKQARACKLDAECPDFQNCIDGGCYSDCEADKDCRGQRVCHRKACRLACKTGTETQPATSCPAANFCESKDGQSGFCMPLAPSNEVLAEVTPGVFRLSERVVAFTSSQVSGSFTIINESPAFQEFVVRRRYHREYTSGRQEQFNDKPLYWVKLGAGNETTSLDAELRVGVEGGGGRAVVRLESADNPTLDRWDGLLEVEHRTLGVRELQLTYNRLPEGQWAGEMFYFANFGTSGLKGWRTHKEDDASVRAVGNALVQRWHAVRSGRLSMREFKAVLTATREETWKNASVRERCPVQGAANPNVGCYLYDNNEGIAVYSSFLPDAPIPSGASGFPLAFNLRPSSVSGRDWSGRIESGVALQYAGNPSLSVRFANDPKTCTKTFGDTCLTLIDALEADIVVGGRVPTTRGDTACLGFAGFEQVSVPWLVPGFLSGASVDSSTDRVFRYECRDTSFPFGSKSDVRERNKSFASANPVPNGESLRRKLRVLDGALINQSELFMLFEEQFPSPLGPQDVEGFQAYGYMLLKRNPADLGAEAYEGSKLADNRQRPIKSAGSCDPEVLRQALGGTSERVSAANVDKLAEIVVRGAPAAALNAVPLAAASSETVHYYCEDTGFFDGGPLDDGTPGAKRVACPAGSKVTFFTLTDDRTTSEVEGSADWMRALSCQTTAGTCRDGQPCAWPEVCINPYSGTPGEKRDNTICTGAKGGCTVGATCNRKGSCNNLLEAWRREASAAGGSGGDWDAVVPPSVPSQAQKLRFREDPVWRCKDQNAALCDADRQDLRVDRDFYPFVRVAKPSFRSLDAEVDQAFRYKTKFKGRDGTSLGFTPDICLADSDLVPYCYDPNAIESIGLRVDCAAHLYTDWYGNLSLSSRGLLKSYLTKNFANVTERDPRRAAPRILDGFEHLQAELLVMLGDEALSDASASRFDLAGQAIAPFPGDELEPGGIRLSGGAGFEMFSLYLATQYYQRALDRFFGLGPLIWRSMGTGPSTLPAGEGFITQATATTWFQRLIGASSHKARAWGEVAKRYQSFNRPDLARLVAQRAYTGAYMESALLSRIMARLTQTADAADVAQIVNQLELAQHTYQSALRGMQEVYESISDDVTMFGYPPDYVPFPALARDADTSAFEEMIDRLKERVAEAAEKESVALSDRRDFETDAAAFQSELSALRIDYDQQLSGLCGSFRVNNPGDPNDVRIVPAIPENLALDARLSLIGDPCGHVGNGELYEAMLEAEQRTLEMGTLRLEQRHLMEQILGTEARATEQCQGTIDYAKWTLKQENGKLALGGVIEALNLGIDAIDRFAETTAKTLGTLKCSPLNGECAVSGAIATTQASLSVGWNLAVLGLKATVSGLSMGKAAIEAEQVVEGIRQSCDSAKLDAKYEILDLFRQADQFGSKLLEQAIAIQSAVARVESIRNQATSLLGARAETLGHLINVEAAKNDPNVRIYAQDSVYAAERTFRRALLEAYKTTRVFEYYTNQSYAAVSDLFLVRMVQYGDPSLEAYTAKLEDEFLTFQEKYGRPDLRLVIVSMRDDIFSIPRLGEGGTALSQSERIERFREALLDPRLLDERGYVSAPFSTTLQQLSPLTFNHKIRFVEAEIVMDENQGDELGRLYLTQRGTSTVRDKKRELKFYSFPSRTAVLNPFFDGERTYSTWAVGSGEDPYRSERLRDRPLVNSGYNISFNQKDEVVNQDIDLGSVDDIRLYLYYTDFTEL